MDVALFKVKQIDPKNTLYHDKNEKVKSKYLFGFSYALDAKQRDFTVNALYFQLYPFPALIDPTGNGLDDIRNNKLRLASEEEFKTDFGGQLRFWKMKYKNEFKTIEEGTANLVNQYLLDHVDKELGTTEEMVAFFKKLRSKLFKADGDLQKFHDNITDDDFFTSTTRCWWIEFVRKVKADFVYPEDEQLDPQLMILIEEIRALEI